MFTYSNRHEQKRNTCSSQHPCRRSGLHVTRIVIKSGDRYLHTVHCTGCHILQQELCKSGIVDDIVALAVYALDGLHRCKLHPLWDALVFHEVCEPCTVVSAVIESAEQRASGRCKNLAWNSSVLLEGSVYSCEYLRRHYTAALSNKQRVVQVLYAVGNRVWHLRAPYF